MAAAGFDQLAGWGIAAVFGGVLLWALIGVLVGLWAGSGVGVGVGTLLLGLTAAVVVALLAWHVHVDTAVVTLPRAACEAAASDTRQGKLPDRQRDVFEWLREGDVRPWRLVTEPTSGTCREGAVTARLRYRMADLREGAGEITVRREDDPMQTTLVIGFFGAWAGFGLLGGLVPLITALRERGLLKPVPQNEPPVRTWRHQLGVAATVSGNLVALGSFAMAIGVHAQLGTTRSLRLVFTAMALACGCWLVAMLLRGRRGLESLLIPVVIGSGFALAAAMLRQMGHA